MKAFNEGEKLPQGPRIIVRAVLYKIQDGIITIFLGERPKNDYITGREFFGGDKHPNETIHEALRREVGEETGLIITEKVDPILILDLVIKSKKALCLIFLLPVDATTIIKISPEHQRCIAMDIYKLGGLNLTPITKEALTRLNIKKLYI